MNTATFQTGQTFEHYNGYIWTITNIQGKQILLESKNHTEGSIIKGSMTEKDLKSVIKAGYYKSV
jgi:hypothetical protein